MTVEIEIGVNLPEEERVTLTEDEIVQHNPVLTHTGKSDFTATVKGSRELEQYAKRQDRINITYSSGTKFTGYIIDVSHRNATTTIKGDGIEKRLEETRPDYDSIGGPVTYSQIALDDALRDYWGRTEFTNFTVTNQSTELVAENEQIQDADTNTEWGNISTIGDTEPFAINNGQLEVVQTCFTVEGEDRDRDSGSVLYSATDYSGGFAAGVAASGEYVEWDFTTNYTIPESEFGVYIRHGSTDSVAPFEVSVILEDGTSETIDSLGGGQGLLLGWEDHGAGDFAGDGWTSGDVPPGTHTIRLEATGSGDEYAADVVAPADNRYSYNFDNDNGGNDGHLDGPELYPDAESFTLDSIKTSYNITAADVSSTWNDTSNNQGIAVSNDGGSSFESVSNTDTLNATFSSAGRTALTRLTFSRYGSRTGTTPETGFNGQTVDVYSLKVDGNDLVVIDELELSRNHFDNLQTLCDYGDFIYVIEHDSSAIGNLVVSCFQRGDEQRPAPDGFDNPIDKSPEIQAGTYYNSIYLEGALQADGTRPTAEVKDSDAISNDGREISPGVLRDQKVTTEAGATFRARSLLSTALSNNDLVGSITVPPSITDPGYARPVTLSEQEGEQYKTVEEVSLTLGTNSAEATFDFTVREGFAEDISSLKRTSRDVGDQV